MVERFNHSLSQLLRCYVDTEDDWEHYLPFVLYAYHTAQHSSTGASPFQLMFGRSPQSAVLQQPIAFDPTTYSAHLQAKLASLQDLVHTNLTANAHQQKVYYDKHTRARSFSPGDLVWLSVPTRGKLQPKWQGKWKIIEIKSLKSLMDKQLRLYTLIDCSIASNLNMIRYLLITLTCTLVGLPPKLIIIFFLNLL